MLSSSTSGGSIADAAGSTSSPYVVSATYQGYLDNTNTLFGQPVPTTAPPSTSQYAGAIMPYFALNYLKFKSVPIVDPSAWNDRSHSYAGCEPGM